MNVLSLFDGMSCGQQALERAGIKVDNYYASEIDKHAIKVTMANYPNTIQLGSVVDVDITKLPKIDLLLGGSPCQSFSFAGSRKGMSTKDSQEVLTLEHYLKLKQEEYEFEGQSYLFWEYMRILTEIRATNPNVLFLLENVIMGDKWESVLSQAIGINPIEINSALVSAQNRRRLYWTNIGLKPQGLFGYLYSGIEQPKDKGLLLKDILEQEVDKKYFISEKMINGFEKHKQRHLEKGTGFGYSPKNKYDKGNSLKANGALCPTDNMIETNEEVIATQIGNSEKFGNSTNKKGKAFTLRKQNPNGIILRKVIQLSQNNKSNGGTQPYQQDRVYSIDGISPALQANLPSKSNMIDISSGDYRFMGIKWRENSSKSGVLQARARQDESCGQVVGIDTKIRRLTPIECERLQTVKDNYTNHVSDSQRYKMLGNGWTIDVISHILSYINK